MRLSVIIPTYKRVEILARCLDHLANQTIKADLEVIVVSDGHDEATVALFENPEWNLNIQFHEVPKSQQGAARNHGVQYASTDRVLFIGDDAFLQPEACALHCEHEEAVLGFTTWDPALEITRVMKWLEQSGWQFGYPKIAKYAHNFIPPEMQPNFSYTIHLSLPTAVAKAHSFREDIDSYGWEDIEWGQRLRDAGIKLFYEPGAIAYHHHYMTLEQSLERMRTLGKSVKNFPEIKAEPKGIKLLAYKASALLPTMSGKHRKAFLKSINFDKQS